jgi:hypothetical protein
MSNAMRPSIEVPVAARGDARLSVPRGLNIMARKKGKEEAG